MAKNYDELATRVVELVGGKNNIFDLTHCVTRLRFNLKDRGLAEMEEIKKLSGVLGAQWSGDQLQVIIGQAMADVYDAVCKKTGFAKQSAVDENLDAGGSKGPGGVKGVVNAIFDGISGSLAPVIPALIGCGMLKVILIFLDMLHVPADNATYQLLSFAGDAGFYFLPILIGAFAAKKCGANMTLGMVIGGLMIYPSFVAGVGAGTAYNFLGIPVYGASYTSTVFPIILACAVMAPIEKFIAKHSPEILRSVLEPLLTIIIMIPVTLCAVGPVGSFLGQYLSAGVLWLYNAIGFVGVALLAAVMPFVVMTGMHGAFVPYLMQMLTAEPYMEPIFFPALVISNINQGIAALAVAVKTKDKEVKSTGLSVGVTAVIAGVTEPAMYGINMKYRTPMYGAMIGSAVGGCVAGLLKAAIHAFAGASSVIALPLFASAEQPSNLLFMTLAVAVGAVVTFVATWVLYKDEKK